MARQTSPRMRKVNELIREVVAESVRDLKDPRVGFVTVTGAETSPDLHHAVVFYSAMGTDEEKASTAAGLESAIPHIQRQIGAQVRMRNTPKLEFRVDASIDEGIRISEKLREMSAETSDDGQQTSDPTDGTNGYG